MMKFEENSFLTFKMLQIEPGNFKLSLVVLSFFCGMTDKMRKIANSSRNTSYENKLSKVKKSMERWVNDALNCEKENGKAFH